MTEADGVRAEINVAIDLEERASASAKDVENSLDQLLGQLMLLGLSTKGSQAEAISATIQGAETEINAVLFRLLHARRELDKWLEAI